MKDHEKFQTFNLKGELVLVSDLNDVEELREMLCREIDCAERIVEASREAAHRLTEAREMWLRSPERGRK